MNHSHWIFGAITLSVNAAPGTKKLMPPAVMESSTRMLIEAGKERSLRMTDFLVQQAFSSCQLALSCIGHLLKKLKGLNPSRQESSIATFSTLFLQAFPTFSCLQALTKSSHTAITTLESLHLFLLHMR